MSRLFWLLLLVFALAAPARAQEDDTAPGDQPPTQQEEPPPPPTQTPVPIIAATPVPTAAAPSRADVGTRAAQSVVVVETEAGQGSGVALTSGVLTAAHVVQDVVSIHITTVDQRQG